MGVIALVLLVSVFGSHKIDTSELAKLQGTWKYIADKSSPPDVNVSSRIMRIRVIARNTIRTQTDEVLKSGRQQSFDKTQVCDGKEHHDLEAEMYETWVCDPKTYDISIKSNGTVVKEVKTDLSADGRTMTYHRRRLGDDGKWIEETAVWQKQ
jgi:hypothetical protein